MTQTTENLIAGLDKAYKASEFSISMNVLGREQVGVKTKIHVKANLKGKLTEPFAEAGFSGNYQREFVVMATTTDAKVTVDKANNNIFDTLDTFIANTICEASLNSPVSP